MKKIKYLWPLVSVIAVLLTTAGITYAWFAHSASLVTLLEIQPPDAITITPVGYDGTELAALDLDFKEGVDIKNEENGTITILRPVRIKSTSPVHQLEVVHTTNLNQLNFNIYPVIDNGGHFSNWGTPLKGSYINPDPDNSKLAKPENLNNYRDEHKVEAHAYPLYWLADCCGDKRYVQEADKSKVAIEVSSGKSTEFDAAKQCDVDYYSTYYILEISWKETTKETDLFYILAQNIAVTPVSSGEGGGNP